MQGTKAWLNAWAFTVGVAARAGLDALFSAHPKLL